MDHTEPLEVTMDEAELAFGLEDDEIVQDECLYEEIDPDFEDTNGGFKTNNPKDNRYKISRPRYPKYHVIGARDLYK